MLSCSTTPTSLSASSLPRFLRPIWVPKLGAQLHPQHDRPFPERNGLHAEGARRSVGQGTDATTHDERHRLGAVHRGLRGALRWGGNCLSIWWSSTRTTTRSAFPLAPMAGQNPSASDLLQSARIAGLSTWTLRWGNTTSSCRRAQATRPRSKNCSRSWASWLPTTKPSSGALAVPRRTMVYPRLRRTGRIASPRVLAGQAPRIRTDAPKQRPGSDGPPTHGAA